MKAFHRVRKAAVLVWVALLIGAPGLVEAADSEKTPGLPHILSARPLENAPGDDELVTLRKALYNERQAIALARYTGYRMGRGGGDELLHSVRGLQRAGMEIYKRDQDRLRLLKDVMELVKGVEAMASERYHRQKASEPPRVRTDAG